MIKKLALALIGIGILNALWLTPSYAQTAQQYPGVTYQAYVQDTGWQDWVSDAQIAGTTGQNLQMEALRINLVDAVAGSSIAYQAHVQDLGWLDWVYDGEIAGTTDQDKRVEAIRIQLVNVSPRYRVAYQAYVQDLGWLDWVYDGEVAGTTGQSRHIEAIRVQILMPTDISTPPINLGVDFGLFVTDTELLEYDVPLVQEMDATWVRMYLPWELIEVIPGEYSWEAFDAVFEGIIAAGLEPLLVIYSAPDWAAEKSCGPISDTQALENFLDAALNRYASYASAWEFINEPDSRELQENYGSIIGCWGLHPEEYAQQLGIFYDRVKTVDPEARVVFGGLAYDSWDRFEKAFFESTLQNGAGQYFDVANVHYYPINYQHPDPDEFPTLAHKVNSIRDTMTRNGIAGKDIWVTETSMWTNEDRGGSVELQRDFIVKEQVRAFGAGANNVFWFAVREEPELWRPSHRWLISREHEPGNGYSTFQHLAEKLTNTSCTGPYQSVPANVEAYEFVSDDYSLYVLWSNTVIQTVTISTSFNAILIDRDGTEFSTIQPEQGAVTFEVGSKPIFLQIPVLRVPVLGNFGIVLLVSSFAWVLRYVVKEN